MSGIKPRVIMPDFLKSMAILFVVTIHTLASFKQHNFFSDLIINYSRLGVPIFIVIFSYFLERSRSKVEKSISSFYFARIKNLLLIFFLWSSVYCLLNFELVRQKDLAKIVTSYWLGYGWAGQYFIIILIQILIFFECLRKLARKKWIYYTGIAASILLYTLIDWNQNHLPGIITKIGYRPIIYWLTYVMLGVRLAHDEKNFPKILGGISIIGFVVEMLFHAVRQSCNGMDYIHPMLLLAVCAFFREGSVMNREWLIFKVSWLKRLISLIGSSTMGIYLINPALIFLLIERTHLNISESQFVHYLMILLIATLGLLITMIGKKLKLDFLLK